ncbi:hydroxyacylglutathione hydrolase [Corallincola spongiicola]|uniref:Hydroxyacylglutathione hydrolase n=1 Tax=Corallincola spongiicola TaxID=2520508 RepID=A0ABY1WVM0_9GAMM|nr:hydroxyacylglutathione hydrolase [Corallincola spongiicola]TAA48668.1 hydroxyacylglutathione hydrolase [Corallincola spongiicola]
MLQVSPIKAFNDNYIWLLHTLNGGIVVDPGDAAPVIAFLTSQQIKLKAVLLTHHHSDHVGGVAKLRQTYPDIKVYGPKAEAVEHSDIQLSHGEIIDVADTGLKLKVLAVPGHTLGHIAYYGENSLFCGDTLFSGGCGRLFEGTADQMHQSLQRLASLPDATEVYCAHEYTQANLAFAMAVEPDNLALQSYQTAVSALRQQDKPSIPSTIEQEKQINPFLRVDQITVISAVSGYLEKSVKAPSAVFAGLRSWKDNF